MIRKPAATPVLKLLALSFVSVSFVACKPGTHINYAGYVLGPQTNIMQATDSSLQSVAPDYRDSSILLATLVQNELKFCTATRVDDGKSKDGFITSGHCFEQSETVNGTDKATPDLLPEACVNTTVYFNFRADQLANTTTAACHPGSLRTDFTGDLAYFQVDGTIPDDVKAFKVYPNDVFPGQLAVYVLHYPDISTNYRTPPGSSNQLPAMAVTTGNCNILGGFSADEQKLDPVLPESVKTSCDIVHGSSGGGLIDPTGPYLAGVVWGGIQLNYGNGTTLSINGATEPAYVRAFLANDKQKMNDLTTHPAMTGTSSAGSSIANKQEASTATDARNLLSCGTFLVRSGGESSSPWLLAFLCLPIFFAFFARRK